MIGRNLLATAAVCAALIAACDGDADSLGDGQGGPGGSAQNGGGRGNGTGGGNGGGTDTPAAPGETPTNSPAGKAYFTANIQPGIAAQCGSCHDNGIGPTWMSRTNADTSYALIFAAGYVSTTSRLLVKGAHGGITTNVLSNDIKASFNTWVTMELKDGGAKAPTNVLGTVGNCIDPQKFAAIGLQNLRTIRRNNENANNCTGCDNAPCRTCHSGDPGSGFVNALGNNVLPQNYTFDQTKLSDPPYVQKYIGVSPTGEPIASNMIQLKSEATQKDKPYTHPMFKLTDAQKTAIQAFVDDAATKFKAGTCTTPPP